VQRLKPGAPVTATPLVIPAPLATPATPAGAATPQASTGDEPAAARDEVRSRA
jgi:hypothetical protein